VIVLLLFIQVMDEINPAARQRLARNVLVLTAQLLADGNERLDPGQHYTTPLFGAATPLGQTSDIFSCLKSPSQRQSPRPSGLGLWRETRSAMPCSFRNVRGGTFLWPGPLGAKKWPGQATVCRSPNNPLVLERARDASSSCETSSCEVHKRCLLLR